MPIRWRLPLDIDSARHKAWALNTFPGLKGLTYLNSAGFTPLPSITIARMKDVFVKNYLEMAGRLDEEAYIKELAVEGASLISSKRDEIAFVTSTTAGINLFANSVRWRRGDNFVLADVEYPSNVLPWLKATASRGARVKVVRSRDDLVSTEAIRKAVDRRTRVLAISLVQFASGQRFDIKVLSEICEKKGTMLFLDGIQALGAMKVDAGRANIAGMAAGGYKWMCGPIGSGILYVSLDHVEELDPQVAHWRSIEQDQQKKIWKHVIAGGRLGVDSVRSWPNASAFEFSPEEVVQIAGLSESLRFLNSVGPGRIEERIARLNDHLLDLLDGYGFVVNTPRAREQRAGIISFRARRRIGTLAEAALVERELGSVKLVVRGGCFRSAAHFFNTRSDLDTAVQRLVAICKARGLL